MKPNMIRIDIAGPIQVGKSSILGSIRDLLVKHNYCVAIPERGERHNQSDALDKAAAHEKPKKDETVFVLTETLTK